MSSRLEVHDRVLSFAVICAAIIVAMACGRSNKPASPSPNTDVSTGYSTEKKDQLTGAVSSVSSDEMRGRPKNVGSTAVYGARGANGVIVIKTKRGT